MRERENNNLDNKTIMVQGTASDVGKSVIVTALCRIFSRQKYRVAPFKSWNMSLNSFVTPGGGEIGIAQAIQAEAAGIKPTVDMQPILVKPKGKGLSQVILRGKPIGDMSYQKDSKYLKLALENIEYALNKLREKNDIVVMEGAGSPVEINVKKWDLANMKVAGIFKTPVILVTDIDRGGALASLVGTMRLLEPEERKLVKGFIINRFRGDINLLTPGLDFLEGYTGKPVLGVIPYLKEINLPVEDSASFKSLPPANLSLADENRIKIGVINLPHLANFTDFLALSLEKDVQLIYINEPREINKVDLIIIPGSKNTTADFQFIKDRGLAGKIIRASQAGVPVIGICAGYQMMGQALYDPYHTEGEWEEIKGLGILPIRTYFLPEKTTHQIKASLTAKAILMEGLEGEEVDGYEIHMGESHYSGQGANKYLFNIDIRSGKRVKVREGIVSDDGLHFGTYIHGLFNNDQLRHTILNNLRDKKGLAHLRRNTYYQQGLIAEYDKLADIVEKSLRMDLVYSLLKGEQKNGC